MKVKFLSQYFAQTYYIDINYQDRTERYSNIFSMDKEYYVHNIFPDADGNTHACLISDASDF
jgi:hypothetical protein